MSPNRSVETRRMEQSAALKQSTFKGQPILSCSLCGLEGADVGLEPCKCQFHAKCFPATFFFAGNDGVKKCPLCSHRDTKFFVKFHPISLDEIQMEESENLILSLAPIFLSQTSKSSDIILDEEIQIRNGRWTPEEKSYVDFLINLFKEGMIPLSDGVSLNNFLRSIFLCKATRLRKKMKNANFCTSMYKLQPNNAQLERDDLVEFSTKQDEFIQSMEDESQRQLYSFSLRQIWTTHLFNFLCAQVGIDSIIAHDWLESIEDIEKEILVAKESKSRYKRRQQVENRRTSTKPPCPTNWATELNQINDSKSTTCGIPEPQVIVPFELKGPVSADDILETMSDVSDELVLSNQPNKRPRIATFREPDRAISQLVDELGDWSPFVNKVASFMKDEKRFQYFDVWCTRNSQNDERYKQGNNQIQLHHVGHSTRSDLESIWNLYHVHQFAKYSSQFTFSPGVGIPGRVLESRSPLWDNNIQHSSLKNFPRVNGAQRHGIKKALGIPMFIDNGCIVIVMYSMDSDFSKDDNLVQKYCSHFQLAFPNPKWEIVLETSDERNSITTQAVINKANDDNDDDDVSEIINLLSTYASIESKSAHFMSLRLILLQPKQTRSSFVTSAIVTLKASYRNYLNLKIRSKKEIANLLVHEWKVMNASGEPSLEIVETRSPLPSILNFQG